MTQATQPQDPAAPQPGSPEYNQAMIAKLESSNVVNTAPDKIEAPAPEAPAPKARPETVPEKFWNSEKGEINVEALLKSYSDLERSRTKPADDKPAPETKADEAAPAEKAPQFTDFEAEVYESGTLSDGAREALKKSGYQDAVIDRLVSGINAEKEVLLGKLHSHVGGKEQFDSLIEWGKKNLPEHERSFIDEQLNSPAYTAAIDLLKMRYEKAVPREPAPINGAPASDTGAFQSQAQMVAAMRDPRYNSDPAYRQSVMRKVAISQF
jgi:hypothetical protein